MKDRTWQRLGIADVALLNRQGRLGLLYLAAMALFLTADQNILFPNLILIEREFAVDRFQMGLVSSAFTVLGALMALAWGYLADRSSRKRLLVWAVILGEIPCLLTGFARTYEELLFWRILTGFGVGGMIPISFSLLGDYFTPSQRNAANAWFGALMGLGVVLGMLVAGVVGPALGWRLPFVLLALPNFLLVPLFWRYCPEPQRGQGEPELRALLEHQVSLPLPPPGGFPALFRVPTNLLAFLQGIPGCIPWGVLPAFIITYYVETKGYSISSATLMTVIFGAGSLAGSLLGGMAGARVQLAAQAYLPLFIGASIFLGAFPAFLVVGYPTGTGRGIVTSTFLALLTGTVAGMAGPNVKALLMNVNLPENRGAIASLFALTDSIGRGAGPLLGGWLAVRHGLGWTLNFAISFWFVSALVWLAIAFTAPRDVSLARATVAARARLALDGRE
ncbi:MAG: MFS transporter [bacterium]|nr:MFS transporter [bacterium]